MKRAVPLSLLAAVGQLAGCYVESQPPPPVAPVYAPVPVYAEVPVGPPPPVYYEASPPPPPRWEARPPPPFYGAVWCDGYWDFGGGAWVWVGGRWNQPRPGYIYAPPRYEHRGGRVEFVRPHWAPSSGYPAAGPPPAYYPGHPDYDRSRGVPPPPSYGNVPPPPPGRGAPPPPSYGNIPPPPPGRGAPPPPSYGSVPPPSHGGPPPHSGNVPPPPGQVTPYGPGSVPPPGPGGVSGHVLRPVEAPGGGTVPPPGSGNRGGPPETHERGDQPGQIGGPLGRGGGGGVPVAQPLPPSHAPGGVAPGSHGGPAMGAPPPVAAPHAAPPPPPAQRYSPPVRPPPPPPPPPPPQLRAPPPAPSGGARPTQVQAKPSPVLNRTGNPARNQAPPVR